jgi:hypothetical protein
MDDATFIVPAPAASSPWEELASVPVELARSRTVTGRLFEKHILNEGPLIHPKTGERINVDGAFTDAMLANFANGVCDIVQVPVANDKNEHVESPAANIGEVVGLRKRDHKVYALIDARDEAAFLSTDYMDTSTGRKAGPTLLHVAVTNRPYVTGLEDYRELASLTDISGEPIVLTEESEVPLTREEMIAALKDEHGIDVEALQLAASDTSGQAALTEALTAALSQVPASGVPDIVGAVVELSRQNAVLAKGYDDLRGERAAERVDALVGTGHIMPKQRDFAVNLLLTRPEEFDQFVPDQPVIPVGEQTSLTVPRDEREQQEQDAEVVRLTAQYKEYFEPRQAVNGQRGR